MSFRARTTYIGRKHIAQTTGFVAIEYVLATVGEGSVMSEIYRKSHIAYDSLEAEFVKCK